MKKLLIFLLLIAAGYMVNAQYVKEADVPLPVKNKFTAMYPAVKQKRWEKENDKYEVSFKNKTEATALLFDAAGNHIQTEIEIEETALPKAVLSYIAENAEGKDIDEASKITAADGTISYKAEIESVEYYFDANGKFLHLKKEAADDDDKG